MAKIYSSGNYVIVEDGDNLYEYAKGHTLYVLVDDIFYIKEITQGQYKVSVTDLEAGNITDLDNAYTVATFTTFLRENTGFKTAPGGSGATPVGATLMKTGQTTSYRTGDDGDIEAGRATDFFTLPSNNPFGNNKRFTGITGGYQLGGVNYNKDGGTTTAALAFPHDIVIDWSTTKWDGTMVLGWSRLYNGNNNWNNNIDNALAYAISTYTTGWRLPNIIELTSIVSYSSVPSLSLNYEPFNLSISGYYDTATSYRVAATAASTRYVLNNLSGQFDPNNKANNAASIRCRLFSITGTTLT
jgi:hypothetical protein